MINERELTKAELDRREIILKNLKGNKRELVKRYGKEAEKVMYGIATKQAKKKIEAENMKKLKEGRDAVCATCGEHGYDEDLDNPCSVCGDNNWSNDYEGLGKELGGFEDYDSADYHARKNGGEAMSYDDWLREFHSKPDIKEIIKAALSKPIVKESEKEDANKEELLSKIEDWVDESDVFALVRQGMFTMDEVVDIITKAVEAKKAIKEVDVVPGKDPEANEKDYEEELDVKQSDEFNIDEELDVEKKSYDGGDIIIVSKGNSWKAILHPENIEAVEDLKNSPGEIYTFKDEQGMNWDVEFVGMGTFHIKNKDQGYSGNFILDDDTPYGRNALGEENKYSKLTEKIAKKLKSQ